MSDTVCCPPRSGSDRRTSCFDYSTKLKALHFGLMSKSIWGRFDAKYGDCQTRGAAVVQKAFKMWRRYRQRERARRAGVVIREQGGSLGREALLWVPQRAARPLWTGIARQWDSREPRGQGPESSLQHQGWQRLHLAAREGGGSR